MLYCINLLGHQEYTPIKETIKFFERNDFEEHNACFVALRSIIELKENINTKEKDIDLIHEVDNFIAQFQTDNNSTL
jgi:hypothetical protein